jgi:hypothetical protein
MQKETLSEFPNSGNFPKNCQVFQKSWVEDIRFPALFPPNSVNIPTWISGKPENLGNVIGILQP